MGDNLFLANISSQNLTELNDTVAKRLLPEYGAILVARNGATPPNKLVYSNESEVEGFQQSVEIGTVEFGDITIELQKAAADALKKAINKAGREGLSITPRSADSGRRRYTDTIYLWKSRVEPALEHWIREEKLDQEEAALIRSLPPFDQVPLVFELEGKGLWFSKDLSKSIIYSVAPPGGSQHLSMLAFDVTEFNQPRVREILAEHFWYQTVVSDLPHFTYLGVPENELPELGLKQISFAERKFWVPDI
ncbi:MAG TPA: hypothetical protein VEV84_01065 [Pyrinomonadaceae bacterium]|jgi:D-alanyl-D-alanine carboxypeptidase|nr:hypothetical protein [Pyrinomonadaceae bacterium]